MAYVVNIIIYVMQRYVLRVFGKLSKSTKFLPIFKNFDALQVFQKTRKTYHLLTYEVQRIKYKF